MQSVVAALGKQFCSSSKDLTPDPRILLDTYLREMKHVHTEIYIKVFIVAQTTQIAITCEQINKIVCTQSMEYSAIKRNGDWYLLQNGRTLKTLC